MERKEVVDTGEVEEGPVGVEIGPQAYGVKK